MYKHKNGITLHKLEQNYSLLLQQRRQDSWWGTHTALLTNETDQVRWFEKLQASNTDLCLIARREDSGLNQVSVGYVLITDIDWVARCCHVSAGMFKEYTNDKERVFGAGIDFIFEMLNMNRVEAEVLRTNLPAQKIEIDYLNFQIEGLKRKAVYKSGEYYDSLILGMLREDWLGSDRLSAYSDGCNEVFSKQIAEDMIQTSIELYGTEQQLREQGW